MKILKVVFTLVFLSITCLGQSSPTSLIKPTGKYGVGTVVYEWADETRILPVTTHTSDKRTIIVQLWYPAAINDRSIPAPYSALSPDYRSVKTNTFLRPSYAKDITASKLILIVPGRGTERYLYTTIAEELASHGFTVASIDMPEIGYVIYQDGLTLKPSKEFQTPPGMMAGPYEKVDAFYEKPTEIGYQDLKFALGKIDDLNKADPNGRFKGKLDLSNIGVFGHSLGGRIAGEFAARNKNIRAIATMEGIPPRDVRYRGKIAVPALMLCSSETLPYAIDNYMSLINNRKNVVFMTELIDFGHNSLTDNPYLYPENFKYKVEPKMGLVISRKLLTGFFGSYLTKNADFMKETEGLKGVKITRYDKTSRFNKKQQIGSVHLSTSIPIAS